MGRIVIGATGDSSNGKGVFCDILKNMGFSYFSLSDVIRNEAAKRKWSTTDRKVLQDLGDELRAKFGNDVLVRRVVETADFKHADNIVIDSIRHPEEINFLKDFFEATVYGVVMPDEMAFELMKERRRPGDPTTFDEFKAMKKRERGKVGTNEMQLDECIRISDKIIENNGTPKQLEEKINSALLEKGIGILSMYKEHDGHVRREHGC